MRITGGVDGVNFLQPRRANEANFTARPLARYQVMKNTFVDISQLEPRDLPFVEAFLKNIKQYFKDKNIGDFAHRQLMEESFNAVKKILSDIGSEAKAKVLLATTSFEPCGILVGNVSKRLNANGNVVYTSRKNRGKKETELDWLATWNPATEGKIKNVGKAIATEYFNMVIEDGFREVYVRSEVPERSYAMEFYKSMGFEELYGEREKIVKYQTNKYIIGNYDNPQDDIIPMIASKPAILRVKADLAERLSRMELDKNSNDLMVKI